MKLGLGLGLRQRVLSSWLRLGTGHASGIQLAMVFAGSCAKTGLNLGLQLQVQLRGRVSDAPARAGMRVDVRTRTTIETAGLRQEMGLGLALGLNPGLQLEPIGRS